MSNPKMGVEKGRKRKKKARGKINSERFDRLKSQTLRVESRVRILQDECVITLMIFDS